MYLSSSFWLNIFSFIENIKKYNQNSIDLSQKIHEYMYEFEEEFQKVWNEKDEDAIRANGEGIERKICLILYDK